MNRATRVAFERVDENDPTLHVDDLREFLPTLSDSEDPTLTVNTLYKLFGDDQTPPSRPAEEPLPPMFDASSDADSLEALFRRFDSTSSTEALHFTPNDFVDDDAVEYEPAEEVVGDRSVVERSTAASPTAAASEATVVSETTTVISETTAMSAVSATQQVALDFQRFAEKFHAFAAECAQR